MISMWVLTSSALQISEDDEENHPPKETETRGTPAAFPTRLDLQRFQRLLDQEELSTIAASEASNKQEVTESKQKPGKDTDQGVTNKGFSSKLLMSYSFESRIAHYDFFLYRNERKQKKEQEKSKTSV